MYAGLIIALVLILFLIIAFCTFFTARLAQLKNRTKFWGIAGLLFGVFGLVFVSYLPSRREDEVDTNPIAYFFAKLPPLSKKTAITIACVGAAVILAVVLYENIPVLIENHKYESEIAKQNYNTEQPSVVDGEVDFVYTGSESSFAISKDGTVYSFGNAPKISQKSKKVLSNDNTVYLLDTDGVLYELGKDEPKKISEKVADFNISETTVAFIKTDGRLYMYGNNEHCQLGLGNDEAVDEPQLVLKDVKQVVCEANFTVALKKSGDVYAFGQSLFEQGDIVLEPEKIIKNVKQVAAGDNFIMALTNDGALNILRKDQTEFTNFASGVTTIDAKKSCAFYITDAKELYAAFNNNVGQLGAKEKFLSEPKLVKKQVEWVSTSGLHTVIKTENGEILSSGYNNCGQLGLGDSRNKFAKFVTVTK